MLVLKIKSSPHILLRRLIDPSLSKIIDPMIHRQVAHELPLVCPGLKRRLGDEPALVLPLQPSGRPALFVIVQVIRDVQTLGRQQPQRFGAQRQIGKALPAIGYNPIGILAAAAAQIKHQPIAPDGLAQCP